MHHVMLQLDKELWGLTHRNIRLYSKGGKVETNTKHPSMDNNKTPPQRLEERARRLQDALELRQPDRVPIMMHISYMLAEIGGITKQELHEIPGKEQELLEQAALEYQPDTIFGTIPSNPIPHLILGDRMTAWPGHGVDPDVQFQFVENEYMKAEDYDALLEDPADWAIRVYMPRVFRSLEGFSLLPPLAMGLFGCYNLLNLGAYTAQPVVDSFRAFARAAEAAAENISLMARNTERMATLGFPPSILVGAIIEAPFDLMSDTLRGMRGIMLDMYQRPDKLLQAEAKVSRFQLESAINFSRTTGINTAFLPLHRGSDGFMSLKQFERFYWPQLKHMLLTLIEHGIRPILFYEGTWDQRLKYLAELPRGKTVGWFQSSDIFKVKETVGDVMCIIGGMPNSLLKGGAIEEVREHTKKLCQVLGKGGGYIISTGVGEMLGSKPELVRAWVDAAKEFGGY